MRKFKDLTLNQIGKVVDSCELLMFIEADGTPFADLQALKVAAGIEREKRANNQFRTPKKKENEHYD